MGGNGYRKKGKIPSSGLGIRVKVHLLPAEQIGIKGGILDAIKNWGKRKKKNRESTRASTFSCE